ncbi:MULTISPECIES: helix-turn-helix domain-containing protein [Streptomyces]|uniref:XRE family transcriptional regulator n=1 Tax=Streptomyces luteosporeus TaxID=173856 RepID=A0ABN3TKH3_9ACTN
MSGGAPLPAECERLAAGLRELKDRTGLSLAALGQRTSYSKSSWERCLKGRQLPPRQAVEALCRLAGEPPERLLALWQLAETAWSGRAGSAPPARETAREPGREPALRQVRAEAPTRTRPKRVYVLSGAGALVAAVVLLPVLLSGTGQDAEVRDSRSAAAEQLSEPGCRGQGCDGANAYDMGCGAQGMVVTLLKQRASDGQRLEIRYAERCGAVWARAMGLHLGDRVELRLPGAGTKAVTAASRRETETYVSTPMTVTGDPNRAEVCLVPAAGGRQECFGRV